MQRHEKQVAIRYPWLFYSNRRRSSYISFFWLFYL